MNAPQTVEYVDKTPRSYPALPWTLTVYTIPGRGRRVVPSVRTVFVFSVLSAVLLLSIHAVGVEGRWFVPAAAGYLLLPGIYQILVRYLEKPAVTIRVTSSDVRISQHVSGKDVSPVDIPISSVRAVSETGKKYPPATFFLMSGGQPLIELFRGEIRDPFLYEAILDYFSQDPALRLPLKDLVTTSGVRSGLLGTKWAIYLAWGLMILILILWDVYEKMMER